MITVGLPLKGIVETRAEELHLRFFKCWFTYKANPRNARGIIVSQVFFTLVDLLLLTKCSQETAGKNGKEYH